MSSTVPARELVRHEKVGSIHDDAVVITIVEVVHQGREACSELLLLLLLVLLHHGLHWEKATLTVFTTACFGTGRGN